MVRNNKGFTLFEMLAVMAILGIVFSIGYVSMQSSLDSTQRAACQNKLELVASAEKRFFATQNRHSEEFENLTSINGDSELVDRMYLDWNQNDNFSINVEIETASPMVYRLSCSEFEDIYLLQEESEYRNDYFLTYTDGEELPISGDEDDINLEDPEDIISEDVFVYGTEIVFRGNYIEGEDATIFIEGNIEKNDFQGGSNINVSNIFINGEININGGTSFASFGSQDYPGEILVNGDVRLGNGVSADIYGELHINGNCSLRYPSINGNVYVNGDLEIDWGLTIADGTKIYYTGSIDYPNNYSQSILDKTEKVDSVPVKEIPQLSIPFTKEASWYDNNGYLNIRNQNVEDDLKIYSDRYQSSGWVDEAENVIIVAYDGNIIINNMGTLTGILFAPKGEVTFIGDRFEGLVISRDGFFVTRGGTDVIFRSATDFVVEEYFPFIP